MKNGTAYNIGPVTGVTFHMAIFRPKSGQNGHLKDQHY